MAGLNHVHLMCRDVDTMAKFFSTHFGAELYERVENLQGAPNLRLRLGESRIYIRGVRPTDKVAKKVEGRPLGLHHIGLDVDDVEAQLEKMRAAGVKVIQEPFTTPGGGRAAFVEGPEGVIVEIMKV